MTNPADRVTQPDLLEQHGVVYCPRCGQKMQQYRQVDLLGNTQTAGYGCDDCNVYLDRLDEIAKLDQQNKTEEGR